MATKRAKKRSTANATERSVPQKVEFKYIFADNYNPVYTNGVFGGISSQGEFVLNFYHERIPMPYASIHRLGPNGRVGEELARLPQTDGHRVIRFVTTGTVMNYEAAKRLHQWLGAKIAQFDELRRDRGTGD